MGNKADKAISIVSEFDAHLNRDQPGSDEYLLFNAGSYVYICAFDKLDHLMTYLSLTTFHKSALIPILKIAKRFPSTVDLLPNCRKIQLTFCSISPPGLIIYKNRVKIFSFEKRTVHTIGGETVRTEAENRRLLPNGLLVPEILEYDDEYPYLVEELVEGWHPSRSLDDWKWFELAFEQLFELYAEYEHRDFNVNEYLSNVDSDPLALRAIDTIRKYEIQESLTRTRIHGDFAHKNIIVANGTPYLIDWDHSQKDLLVSDFFYLLVDISRQRGDATLFEQMVRQRGEGYRVVQNYWDIIGDIESQYKPGLPVFYLLYEVQRSPTENKYRPLLRDLLERLE